MEGRKLELENEELPLGCCCQKGKPGSICTLVPSGRQHHVGKLESDLPCGLVTSMILSGEDSCCPGSELSLHTQTCQWSPHHTGVAGDLGDPQLWGGSCNWPGPWWPCGETHRSFLPRSWFTLSVTGRGAAEPSRETQDPLMALPELP